jgi:hypothetical protein
MIIAQNVLLRKLRLRTAEHVESSDFDHYLNLFKEGLTEDQVRSGSFSSSQPHRPGMAPHWRKPPDVLRAGRIVGRHCFPHGTGKYPSIVCLQETKLIVISDFDMVQFIGPGFNYVFRPADGTRGGILIAWCSSSWVASNTSMRTYSISAKLQHNSGGEDWWLTSVYDPSTDAAKPDFLAELHELRLVRSGPWILCGNFNMIYKAEDKNNN